MRMAEGHTLPCGGRNAAGEVVILEAGSLAGERFYRTKTFQENGWCRINTYYESGDQDETYKR